MKRLLKIFLFLISFILVVAIIVCVVLGVMFYDNKDNTPKEIKENDYQVNYLVEREIYQSIKEINSNHGIALSLDDYALNELLYAIISEINVEGINIKGVYCQENTDQSYLIEIPVKVFGFDSVIRGKIKLEEKENELIIKLENAKIGKFNLTNNFFKKNVFSKINVQEVEDKLLDQGIIAKINFSDFVVSLDIDSCINFLKKQFKGSSLELLDVALSTCNENPGLLSILTGENNQLGVYINTEKFKYDQVRDGNLNYPLDLESAKEKTLNDQNYSDQYASELFNYYVSGYEVLTEDQKKVIDSFGLDTSYTGIRNSSTLTMKEIIEEQSSYSLLEGIITSGKFSLKISEDNFNELLSTLDIIGSSFVYSFENDFVYVTFEGISMNINKDYFDLSLILSLNGQRIVANVSFDSKSNNDSYINGDLKSLRIGEVTVDEKYLNQVFAYLKEILNEEWLVIDAENLKIKVDLTGMLTDNQLISFLLRNSFSCTSSFSSDGYMEMSYSL